MLKIKINNIFDNLPASRKREAFRVLARGRYFRIERIVSCGQATPKNKWLCERTAEWVIVLKGRARLLFEGNKRKIYLKPGDYVFIPSGERHRVDWTHPRQKTVWLALLRLGG
jgi:cupin 2 domain-containing protein